MLVKCIIGTSGKLSYDQTISFEFLWVFGLGLIFGFLGFWVWVWIWLGRDPDLNPKPKFFLGKTSAYDLKIKASN
jgi:hypothetical protein